MVDGRKRSFLIDKDKIEQMKRYFILMLIGIVGNPTYVAQLKESLIHKEVKFDSLDQSQGLTREDVKLKEDIENLKAWIEGVERYF